MKADHFKPRYRITWGSPGAPSRGDDYALAARPRKRETALQRAEEALSILPEGFMLWVWEEARPGSWTCIKNYGGGPA